MVKNDSALIIITDLVKQCNLFNFVSFFIHDKLSTHIIYRFRPSMHERGVRKEWFRM